MRKVIVHVDPQTGNTCITRCVPWARLARAVTIDGVHHEFDPAPLERVPIEPAIRNIDAYEAIEPHVEWAETEEEFARRAADEQVDEIEPHPGTGFMRRTGRRIGKIMPAGTPYHIVDDAEVPARGKSRGRLEYKNGVFKHRP